MARKRARTATRGPDRASRKSQVLGSEVQESQRVGRHGEPVNPTTALRSRPHKSGSLPAIRLRNRRVDQDGSRQPVPSSKLRIRRQKSPPPAEVEGNADQPTTTRCGRQRYLRQLLGPTNNHPVVQEESAVALRWQSSPSPKPKTKRHLPRRIRARKSHAAGPLAPPMKAPHPTKPPNNPPKTASTAASLLKPNPPRLTPHPPPQTLNPPTAT
jgi:hypothetical protein